MKRSYLFFVFMIILIFTSCRGTQEITMFQDIQEDMVMNGVPREAPVYIIKPFDNLYLSILTLDPEVNQLLNPSSQGGTNTGGTNQQYGERVSQYINGYMVEADGTINAPLLGKIQLAGLNLVDAQKYVKEKAEELLKDPNVKVKVLNFKVNVSGEVRSPGLYYNYEGSLNLLDAISMANGITEFANLNKVLVIRHYQNNSKTFNLHLTDKSLYFSDAFYLQPNDMVYLPPNKNKRMRENTATYGLFLSTISTILVLAAFIIK